MELTMQDIKRIIDSVRFHHISMRHRVESGNCSEPLIADMKESMKRDEELLNKLYEMNSYRVA